MLDSQQLKRQLIFACAFDFFIVAQPQKYLAGQFFILPEFKFWMIA